MIADSCVLSSEARHFPVVSEQLNRVPTAPVYIIAHAVANGVNDIDIFPA